MIIMKLLASLLLLSSLTCTNQAQNQQAVLNRDTSAYQTRNASSGGTGKFYLGREISQVMGAAGADWLDRNERQQEENSSLAISKLPLSLNSVVADIGAGSGYYSFRIAKKIPQGKVFAVEVQDEFISLLSGRKQDLNLANVEIIKGSEKSPNLPENSTDLAIMVDVYHELLYPREMLQEIRKSLKPAGKLLLLEYRAEDPNIAIKALHKMSVAQVTKELSANGFKLVKREDFLPIQHFLLYEKE